MFSANQKTLTLDQNGERLQGEITGSPCRHGCGAKSC